MKRYVAILALLSIFPVYAFGQNKVVRSLGCTAATASGTTYACSPTQSISALFDGDLYKFLADVDNTGSATFNINSLGAKTMKKLAGTTNLAAADIKAGEWVYLVYHSTGDYFEMINPIANVPAGSGDASTNTSTSVVDEVVLFKDTTGKVLGRASCTGISKLAAGVLSCVSAPSGAILGDTDPQTISGKTYTNPSLGSNSRLTVTKTAGLGGTTANLLVKLDSSGNAILPSTSDVSIGLLGIAGSTASNGNPVEIYITGIGSCVADNTTTANNLLGVGTSTAGRCKDLGTTDASAIAYNIQIVGRALTGVTAGSNVSVQIFGPGIYGTQLTAITGSMLTNNTIGTNQLASGIVWSSPSLGNSYLSTSGTAGTGGTTAGLLVKRDSSGNFITAATSDTGTGVSGIAVSSVSATASVEAATRGTINCVADNSTTINNLVGVGTTTAGRCKDLGTTDTGAVSYNIQILGRALTPVSAAANVSVNLWGPGHFGTLIPSATTSVAGISQLATSSETTTGTSTTKTITPSALAQSVIFGRKVAVIPVIDFATALTTGDGKYYFPVPQEMNGMNLVAVSAQVNTVSSSGLVTVAFDRCAVVATGNMCSGTVVDMMTTNLTIDANENKSSTAATAAVINTSNDDLATDQVIRINIDGAGTGTLGLTVTLEAQLP